MGVEGDTNALRQPPEWPKAVQGSDGVANRGLLFLHADADQELDLLALGRGQSIAHLALGLGQGRFGAPEPLRTDRLGMGAGSAVLSDFDDDGDQDLSYLSTLSNNDEPRRARATVLLNQGDGSFVARISDFDGYVGPSLSGDFNEDGHADLVVAVPASNQEPGHSTQLLKLFGRGDGTFELAPGTPLRVNNLSATQLLWGSLHDAGSQELVIAGNDDSGQGAFAIHQPLAERVAPPAIVNLPDEQGPHQVKAADLDGDGRDELVFYSANQRNVSTLHFAVDAAPAVTRHHVEGDLYALAEGLTLADLNRDGNLDLLLPGSDTRSTEGFLFGPVLIVAYGDGLGRFGSHRVLQLAASDGEFGAEALSADLNHDAQPDLVLGTYGASGAAGRTFTVLGPLSGDEPASEPF